MRSPFATLAELFIPMGARPGSARVYIGSRIPAELAAYYAAQGITLAAAILAYGRGDTYAFQAVGANTGPGSTTFWLTGMVGPNLGGVLTVQEVSRTYWDTDDYVHQINRAGVGTLLVNNYLQVSGSARYEIDSISAPRGGRLWLADPNNAAITLANADFFVTTFTFRAGRAYQVEIGGRYSTSAATNVFQLALWWVASGTDVQTFGGFGPQNGAVPMSLYGSVVVRRTAVTDATSTLTVHGTTNAGTATWIGAAGAPRYLRITDIGAAADFPGAPVIP